MPGPAEPWAPLAVPRVSELIADRIVALIDGDQLQPGDRLPSERALAELLGVSRPSLREALRTLQTRGRVEVRRGAGVFVAEPDGLRDLRSAVAQENLTLSELFAMREVLEGPAAHWAAELGDPQRLDDVRAAHDAVQAASAGSDVDTTALRRLDVALHLAIVEAAGNRFLRRTTGVLLELLNRGMVTTLAIPGRLEQARAEHERLVGAILRGDGPEAEVAARAHVAAARDAALTRLRESGQ